MAEGILFGGYLLPEELFIPIFKEWYIQKKDNFKKALQIEIINVLEEMIKTGTRVSQSTGALKSTTIKIKDKYNAKIIYENWERISRDYFGNGSVSLIAATKFDKQNYQWTNIIEENKIVNEKGINIRKKGLSLLEEEMQDIQTIFAAAEVQDLINNHFDSLVLALNTYHLTKEDAEAMHTLLWYRKSKLNRSGFTNSTYDKIIFSGQSNKAGKQLDAYMNHMGNYHQELFSLMSGQILSDATLLNNAANTFHDDFYKMFSIKRDEVQVWLLDSLNSASWLTGGDIIVVGKDGSVIYNIQLKTTGRGKTFEVASSALLSFSKKMLELINNDATPEELAKYMFNTLKTTSANDLNIVDTFLEQNCYDIVRQNLNLNINI